jgi:hypothetical protein
VSPVYLASPNSRRNEHQASPLNRAVLTAAAELTRVNPNCPAPPIIEPDEPGEVEIEMTFRRTIAGLRRLPRRERPAAVQAAKDTRMMALKVLREKRAYKRQAEYMLRKLKAGPMPT